MWLNENAGTLVLILGIVIVALVAVVLCLVLSLRSRFASQRLKFVGLYATDMATRQVYASLTIGNRSVSEIALKEIGIKNGRVAFDLTPLYRAKHGMDAHANIVIEQRHSVDFYVTVQELEGILVEGKAGVLRLYAVDLMGNLYQGRVNAVRRMLADRAAGRLAEPAPAQPAMPAPVQPPAPEPAPVPVQEFQDFGPDTVARKLVVGPMSSPEQQEAPLECRPEALFRR